MKNVVWKIIIFIIIISIVGISSFYFLYQPSISLNGEEIVIIDVGNDYHELGAKAVILNKEFDVSEILGNVDCDMVGTYQLNYVFHSNFLFNRAEIVRKVIVVDRDNPIISLEGEERVSPYVGSKYEESGFIAKDKYDGDLTDKVVVTNNVDTSTAGIYEIIYEVSDSSGNKFQTKRIVEVKIKPTTTAPQGQGRGISILMYHYFYDEEKGESGPNSNYMEIHDFEEQVKYLVDNNYYFPTWKEVADFVNGKIDLPEKSVVLTSDDGDWSFFYEAVPIIKKYNARITAFIITSSLQDKSLLNQNRDIVTFESHTHNMHRGGCSGGAGGKFRCISYEDGLNDLKTSFSILGSSDALAYPYGDCNDNVLSITKDSGVLVGVTTKHGRAKKGMDPLRLPRMRMYQGISFKGFINSL